MANDRMERGRGRRPGLVKKKRQNTRLFYAAIAIVAVAGIGALTYVGTKSNGQVASTQYDPSLPSVKSAGYVLGSAKAPLEVTEFADFECPACGNFATVTEPDVRARLVNTGEIRVRFVDYPLSMHANTWNASRAAACADEQGKFWEMHDALFQTQDQWNGEATRNPDKVLKDIAKRIGLNPDQFNSCIDTKRTQAKVQAHYQLGEQNKVQQTPTFIIGDRTVPGALTYDQFKAAVDAALAKSGRPAAVPTGDTAGRRPSDPAANIPR